MNTPKTEVELAAESTKLKIEKIQLLQKLDFLYS